MRRPRHPRNPDLQSLTYNPKSSLYEIAENGIVYGIPLELTRLLKEYSRGGPSNSEPLISSWYNRLDREARKKIIRHGDIPATASDFYPDPEY